MDNQIGRLVLLDAGSSGTRLYAYRWQKINGSVPKVELVYTGTMKNKGPIEKNATEKDLKAYLDSLFDPVGLKPGETLLTKFGFKTLADLTKVPILVLGTAGMRVFKRDHLIEHDKLHQRIESYIKNLGDAVLSKYETITGESEAAYGWVAANFLLGAFSTEYETKVQDTVGYVEMGGQSAQIAFQPFENELTPDKLHDGDITTVKLGKREFDLVLKTWDLGSNQAWREYQSDVVTTGATAATDPAASSDAAVVDGRTTYADSDSPHGRKWTYLEESGPAPRQEFKLQGDGDFDYQRFHEKVLKVLDRLSQPAPARGSRLLDENLVAALKARHFVGGANFWYSTRGVFGRNVDVKGTPKTTVFSFKEYLAEVKSTTGLAWPYLQLRLRHESEDVMGNAWFVAEWIKCVLINGFGFNFAHQPSAQRQDDLAFRPYGGTANAGLTWTLGRAFLYASKLSEQDVELVIRPGLGIIANRHQNKLNVAMKAKAVRLEESLWDYITMAASFRRRTDVRGNVERAKRMIDLAKAAAKTSRNLRWAALPGEVAELEGGAELEDEAAEMLENAVNELVKGGMDRKISTQEIENMVWVIKKVAGVPEGEINSN